MHASALQDYQTISRVVSDAFGGDQKGASSPPEAEEPATAEDFKAAFAKVFG